MNLCCLGYCWLSFQTIIFLPNSATVFFPQDLKKVLQFCKLPELSPSPLSSTLITWQFPITSVRKKTKNKQKKTKEA